MSSATFWSTTKNEKIFTAVHFGVDQTASINACITVCRMSLTQLGADIAWRWHSSYLSLTRLGADRAWHRQGNIFLVKENIGTLFYWFIAIFILINQCTGKWEFLQNHAVRWDKTRRKQVCPSMSEGTTDSRGVEMKTSILLCLNCRDIL